MKLLSLALMTLSMQAAILNLNTGQSPGTIGTFPDSNWTIG